MLIKVIARKAWPIWSPASGGRGLDGHLIGEFALP
jgi:hypothetical protein